MLTALQTRKLTRAFSLFDVDRNGFNEYMAGWQALLQLGDSNGVETPC